MAADTWPLLWHFAGHWWVKVRLQCRTLLATSINAALGPCTCASIVDADQSVCCQSGSSSMIVLPTAIYMLAPEDQLHMQLSGFATCRLYTCMDRPTKLLHCPGQHCLGCHPLDGIQLGSISLSVCVAFMPRAKSRRLPGGWVPTVATPASKAEVHRIIVIGVVTSLHGNMQQPNWFLLAQMCYRFGQGPELGLNCIAGFAPGSILGRQHSYH